MSLLRSTKFVRYFTGAARTLILNSAKAAETNTLINPKTLCGLNNVLVRDYSTSKKTESLEPLLQKLDSDVRRVGRISKKDIDEVFDEIRSKNNITSSQSLLVIRCCGELVPEELPEQRTLLVQKIWNVLTERGIPMDISHYNALLRVYIENEHLFSPAKFLEELEKKGLQPNRVTYQRLMWRYCQDGDVEGATKVLEKMRELNFPVSEPVLNALVMGHAFHGDTEGAKAVLQTMAGAGLQPSNRTYTLLACGYAKQGDLAGVEDVIKIATEKDAYMTDKDILDIVEHLSLGGHGDKVEQLFPHLQKSVGYNQEVCNLILRLLNKGQDEPAKKVMNTMPKSTNIDDTLFKGAFFVKHLLKLGRPIDSVIKTCSDLQKDDLVPNAFYIATEGALQLGQIELAQNLFKELKRCGIEIRQHYYWPLLVQKGKEGDEEGLLQILRNMTTDGLVPTGETLRDYVIPYMVERDTPQNVILKLQICGIPTIVCARNIMLELLESGKTRKAAQIAVEYHPRGQYNLVARPLLNSLSKTKDIDSFVTILHVTSSKVTNLEDESNDEVPNDDRDTIETGRLVKSAVKILGTPALCEELLTKIHSKGIRLSADSAESIQMYLGEQMSNNLSELLTQLTSSDLESVPVENVKRDPGVRNSAQLEQLINRLKSKEGSNIKRLQKQLLSLYIKENNIVKVGSYVEELKGENFELSPATLAQLFEFYCQHDQIDRANEYKAQINEKYPDFVLNKFKLIQMAFALVRANRYDEAVKFLQEHKIPEESEPPSFVYNSKCWQMLNVLAEQKDDVKVKELTNILIERNYIEASNVHLGPLIKVHILKDDIDTALKEFENCCKKYRSTPWKGELMKALILKEDATKLQWLADLSTQIHGEVNILHDLVLAFVECGRLRQARRILETPGLHTRLRRLDDACLRYVEEGKSEHLEGLLEATKELSHIDRSNIFYHLLVTYCKADETDKAVGLWTVLQEEGEIPSDQFLNYLGKHLKSKNRKVPFVLPDDNTVKVKKTHVTVPKQSVPAKPTKNQVSEQVENLIKDGKHEEAMNVTLKSVNEGVMPRPNILKFLLKSLAVDGNVEKIKEFGQYANDSLKKRITYDDKLTLAIFKRGSGASHVDNLLETFSRARTDQEWEEALLRFPRSNSLVSVIDNEAILAKCHKIAEMAATKGFTTPANLLWMEYLLAGKEKEADNLWNSSLRNASALVFRRLLQESHVRNEPRLIEKLIETLKSNQEISLGSVGNAYSRLINLHLLSNRLEEAESVLQRALDSGLKGEHFNKNTVNRLKTEIEQAGREFKYSIN
ncbi:leucine-rich PPR motif-containing protein, mitochondrial [Plodia interpunctella]|uniref:leucine-rich PPR motif-containing protein, mitochondrial n=1 Tax=Plodia interpunctella TaxID=58824 RepID=UPI002367B925|nr:leucine-rich PPR motif-containing protein, mitochondrial [Plodia interpunctella]